MKVTKAMVKVGPIKKKVHLKVNLVRDLKQLLKTKDQALLLLLKVDLNMEVPKEVMLPEATPMLKLLLRNSDLN